MSNIPTAEEFATEHNEARMPKGVSYQKEISELMIEFAKLHCIAQRESILENVKIEYFLEGEDEFGNDVYGEKINEQSILEAYLLDNIK
jgi:hypothetical protein